MMKDKSSAAGILESTIEKVKDLVNVSTIIGEPMKVEGGVTIIPVSKLLMVLLQVVQISHQRIIKIFSVAAVVPVLLFFQ